MGTRWIRLLRRSAGLLWVALFVSLLAVTALPPDAAHTGRTVFVIRGGSMEPMIPLGSLILVAPRDASALAVGDVVTVRADNGVVYTHRIRRVLEDGPARRFELQGDANASPDGRLVPARAVIGRADVHIPFAGYLTALLATPSGVVSVIATLGCLLLAIWLLEDLERGSRPARPGRGGEPVPAPA
jgi:signal peptidase